jgi:hypothetical protein
MRVRIEGCAEIGRGSVQPCSELSTLDCKNVHLFFLFFCFTSRVSRVRVSLGGPSRVHWFRGTVGRVMGRHIYLSFSVTGIRIYLFFLLFTIYLTSGRPTESTDVTCTCPRWRQEPPFCSEIDEEPTCDSEIDAVITRDSPSLSRGITREYRDL